MAMTIDDLINMVRVRPPVPVTVPGVGELYFRHPTFEEWHTLTTAHQKTAGEATPIDLICRTVAAAVADETGKPLMTPADAKKLSDRDAAAVMRIYTMAVETVFPVDDAAVSAAEKN